MRLTGYVVIELKTGKFQPEYAGKLNFYVALVDDMLRRDYGSLSQDRCDSLNQDHPGLAGCL
ncbi:hypothetical protein [Arthrobacter sp. DR-2P]|nr:hypothetical protein [Arthrobacter sp. DR-2P]